jgi:hypothetical protein
MLYAVSQVRPPLTTAGNRIPPPAGLGEGNPPGNTYYVDYVGGSDSNNGLATSSPWQHAPGDPNAQNVPIATHLLPGDTVIFKGGVSYNGTIVIKYSGSPGEPITYDGNSQGTFGTGKAIINGQGVKLGVNARQYGFESTYSYVANYITINNFNITNMRYIYADENGGANAGGIGLYGNSGTNVTIENNFINQVQRIPWPVNNAIEYDAVSNTVSATSTTLTDTSGNFLPYVGTPGTNANYKVYVGWPPDDYHLGWGYIGNAITSNTVEIYQDFNLITPGWDDVDPAGQSSNYIYFIYNLSLGSVNGSAM